MNRFNSPLMVFSNVLKHTVLPIALTGWMVTMGVGFLASKALAPQAQAVEKNEDEDEDGNGDGRWGPPHTGSQTTTGGRDYCPEVDLGAIALIPDTHWGMSTTQTPTIWFYLPYTSEPMAYGEFFLLDDQGFEQLEPISFTGSETAGWVSITMPELNPPLVEGTDYHWAIQIYCRPDQFSPLTLEGWLQVNSPSDSVTAALKEGTVPAYQVYWNEGLWFDAVHELMQQRLTNPADTELTAQWLTLLKEGGVGTNLENDRLLLDTLPIIGPVSGQ